jgi:hypothetical protein
MQMREPDASLSHSQEKRLLKAAADIARTEYPSAQRLSCPTSEDLELLARRRTDLADSPQIVNHVGTCSQCFIEYSQYRVAHKRRFGYAITASLAGVGVLVLIGYVLQRPSPTLHRAPTALAQSPKPVTQTAALVLDLRQQGLTRGATPNWSQPVTPRLPRVRLSLQIYLPIGSDEGAYDLAFTRNSTGPIIPISGSARFADKIVILPICLDLTNSAPGLYHLYLRHGQSQWRTYPVLLE